MAAVAGRDPAAAGDRDDAAVVGEAAPTAFQLLPSALGTGSQASVSPTGGAVPVESRVSTAGPPAPTSAW